MNIPTNTSDLRDMNGAIDKHIDNMAPQDERRAAWKKAYDHLRLAIKSLDAAIILEKTP